MNQLNSILIEGFVHEKPKTRLTENNKTVGEFGVRTYRSFKTETGYEKEVSYFDIVVWGRLAEVCAENLDKGREVRVVGRLTQQRWTDKDGTDHRAVKIVAEHVEFKPVPKDGKSPEPPEEDIPEEGIDLGEVDD